MPTPASIRAITDATRLHHGVLTADEVALTQRQLDRCCAAGVLRRRHPGVYINPAVPASAHQDLAAAVAAGGTLAAAWGRSAAALWGLRLDFPSTPEIVVPRRRVARVEGALVHRSSDLCWDHVSQRHGIRVTNPLVTVLDLGVVLDPIEIAEVIITGRQHKLFSHEAVRATLSRLARPGRTGVRAVRSALDLAMIGDRPADSVLEMRFALLAERCGLPPYSYQHKVVRGTRTYFIDFAYPDVMLAIEVDGYEKRQSSASLTNDDVRQNDLVLEGWTVLRFTWPRICADPASVAADVLDELGSLSDRFGRRGFRDVVDAGRRQALGSLSDRNGG